MPSLGFLQARMKLERNKGPVTQTPPSPGPDLEETCSQLPLRRHEGVCRSYEPAVLHCGLPGSKPPSPAPAPAVIHLHVIPK